MVEATHAQNTRVTLPPQNSVGLIYDLLLAIQVPQTSKDEREKAQKRLKSLCKYISTSLTYNCLSSSIHCSTR